MTKLLISMKEFCELAGIGRTHAAQIVAERRVESIRLGGRRLIVLASVEEMIAQALADEQR